MHNLSPMNWACDLYREGVCQRDPCIYEQGSSYFEMGKCQLLVLTGLMLTKADGEKNIMNGRDQLLSLVNKFFQRHEDYNGRFGGSKEWQKVEREVRPLVDVVQRMMLKLSLKVKSSDLNVYKNTRKSLKKSVKDLEEKMKKIDPKYMLSSDTV